MPSILQSPAVIDAHQDLRLTPLFVLDPGNLDISIWEIKQSYRHQGPEETIVRMIPAKAVGNKLDGYRILSQDGGEERCLVFNIQSDCHLRNNGEPN